MPLFHLFFSNGDSHHGEGFDEMTANDVFRWVRPESLIRTQCSNYNSVLDFIFVRSGTKNWGATSEIIEMADGYCRDYRTNTKDSDHRPVFGVFRISH